MSGANRNINGTGSLNARIASAQATRPEPPKDLKRLFSEAHYFVFYQYVEARPYQDWTIPDIRYLAQLALLDVIVMSCLEDLTNVGYSIMNAKGETVAHPAMTAMVRAQSAASSITRRLGISVEGIISPTMAAKKSQSQSKIAKAQGDSSSPAQQLLA